MLLAAALCLLPQGVSQPAAPGPAARDPTVRAPSALVAISGDADPGKPDGALTARAQSALAAMQSTYFRHGTGGYAATTGAPRPAFLWGDSWALAALEDVAALPGGRRYLPLVRAAAGGLQAYWDPAAQPPAYAPSPHPGRGAIKYFDDNAWVGLDLMSAWHLTGTPAYLLRAEAVMRYQESGWNPAGGGIWWSDRHGYRNTAANAATADLAARLYLATGDPTDLAWAERIYAWDRRTLVGPDGRVADGIRRLAAVPDDHQWTYNYGTVVAAAVELLQATGRRAYLADAESVATYALAHLRRAGGAWLSPSRFDGVLADGLLLLWRQDRRPDLAATLTGTAGFAWSRAHTGGGLFGRDWSGPPPRGSVPLLTDTGAVRALAAGAVVARAGPRAADPAHAVGGRWPRARRETVDVRIPGPGTGGPR